MISIISAFSKNRAIGFEGKIPWNIPSDKENFKRLTMGNIVIMGRKSYEEIGHPLVGRTNIIVSSTTEFKGDFLYTATSLNKAITLAKSIISESNKPCEIFLCGGERIYKEGLSYADTLYLTEIDAFFEGDAFFPKIDDSFELVQSENISGEYNYKNCVYKRKTN